MVEYLLRAMRDCGRIELRHQTPAGWISGLFDNAELLRMEARRRAGIGNLYTSISAPRLLRATNAMNGRALRDADIGYHVRLPFDFDPVRPAGVAATGGEMRAAMAAAKRLMAALHAAGWPAPAMGASGNGAHLLYRCRLPVSAETSEMLATLYRGLAEFGDERAHFDTSVRNPARIWRLYGTTNRKGEPTAERPHRVAAVNLPSRWEGVSPRAIERLASRYARRPESRATARSGPSAGRPRVAGAGDYSTLDVVSWFKAHSAYRRSLGEGKHAVACPWSGEHSTESGPMDTSTVIWDARPGAWPTFHCSHAHCDGRSLRDVLALWADADGFCATAWRARR